MTDYSRGFLEATDDRVTVVIAVTQPFNLTNFVTASEETGLYKLSPVVRFYCDSDNKFETFITKSTLSPRTYSYYRYIQGTQKAKSNILKGSMG